MARRDAEIARAEAHAASLRAEMASRDKGTFGEGAARLETGSVMDWMLKPKNGNGKVRNGTGRPGSKGAGAGARPGAHTLGAMRL